MYIHVHFCSFTVPRPVVEVTSIDTVEYGKATTLECNVIAVRGIASRVDIHWTTAFLSRVVRRVDNVTANIVNNSAVYTDQLVTSPLRTEDDGIVYYCVVNITTTSSFNGWGGIRLNFDGKYIGTHNM